MPASSYPPIPSPSAPRIEHHPPIQLIGQRILSSWINDQTSALWRPFRARRQDIPNRPDARNYSIQRYGAAMATGTMSPTTTFEKWATVPVSSLAAIPEGMEAFGLPGGLYAVYTHHGPPQAWPAVAQYLFGTWLPASPYRLDDRDHFEIFDDSYHPLAPDAVEDIWIPIAPR